VGDLGGVDAEEADSSERAAGEALYAQRVAVDDRGHADLGGITLGRVSACRGAG